MTRENTTGFVREASGTLTAMTTGGASQYYLTEVQGSVIGLVDASGKRTATYSYGPSGKESNPYAYAAGDPVNRTDPSGLLSLGEGLGLAGTVVGLVALAPVSAPVAIGAAAVGTGECCGVHRIGQFCRGNCSGRNPGTGDGWRRSRDKAGWYRGKTGLGVDLGYTALGYFGGAGITGGWL